MSKGLSFQPAVEEIRSLYYLQCQWGPMYKFPVWLPLQINKTSAKNIISFHFIFLFLRGEDESQAEWSQKPQPRRCHGKLSTQETKKREKIPTMPEQQSSAPYSSGPRRSSSLQARVSVCGLANKHMLFAHKPKVFPTCALPCRKLPPPSVCFMFQSIDI